MKRKMDFKIKIDNIGRLKNAIISVRPLTILAGPNNTGKSFFSKTLYSIFDAMNSNLLLEQIRYYVLPLTSRLGFLETLLLRDQKNENDVYIDSIRLARSATRSLVKSCETLAFQKEGLSFYSQETYNKITPNISQIIQSSKKLIPFVEKLKPKVLDGTIPHLDEIKTNIQKLEEIKNSTPEKLFEQSLSKILKENLMGNFQVSNLEKLKRDEKKKSSIEIINMNKIVINDNLIDIQNINQQGITILQNNFRVIYIESPVHWKLKSALSRAARPAFFDYKKRSSLSVPKYFIDLSFMLMEELPGDLTQNFQDLLTNLTENIIKGKIAIDESGTLRFQESKGGQYSLPMTATGIVPLGLLALLIDSHG